MGHESGHMHPTELVVTHTMQGTQLQIGSGAYKEGGEASGFPLMLFLPEGPRGRGLCAPFRLIVLLSN